MNDTRTNRPDRTAEEGDETPAARILTRREALTFLSTLGVGVAGVSVLSGCGGGGESSPSTLTGSTGRATITITWPATTTTSKLVPVDSQSIVISFAQSGTVVSTQTVTRPTSGNTSTVTFASLPAVSLSATATAYPNTDGTGTAQATATVTATITAGENTAVSIAMASTISSLSITPSSPTVAVGSTTTLSVVADDAAGSIVLITSATISWASSNTAVVTVTTAGVVTGVAAGTTTLTVTESESGKTASVTLTVTGSSSSSVTAEGEIGPYFTDDSATGYNRSNIVSNLDGTDTQTGIPLTLNLVVLDSENNDAAYAGAQVDIWHCNAAGVYSNESSENTLGQSWLRGYQITDSKGKVSFTTILPGWYSGRTTHIHLRVRSKYSTASSTTGESNTTQVFFPQTLIDTVDTTIAPYSAEGQNPTTNAADRVYTTETLGQNQLTLTGNNTTGYTTTFTIYLPITMEY